MKELDDYKRAESIQARIKAKQSLTQLYKDFYFRYANCISRSPNLGVNIEVGSGAGFLKEIVPEAITSDILPYKMIDLVMDAGNLPFADCSLNSVFMLNTLHHIPKPTKLFQELSRCLVPGGRVLVIDQYHGLVSKFIYQYLHHEPYHPDDLNWDFESSGPLSDANGALCWIIFYRDISLFQKRYPELKIIKRVPHTPLRYWLAGGLKQWNLLPKFVDGTVTILDSWLASTVSSLCSFVDVELEKQSGIH